MSLTFIESFVLTIDGRVTVCRRQPQELSTCLMTSSIAIDQSSKPYTAAPRPWTPSFPGILYGMF